jgi:hypothetical protein
MLIRRPEAVARQVSQQNLKRKNFFDRKFSVRNNGQLKTQAKE